MISDSNALVHRYPELNIDIGTPGGWLDGRFLALLIFTPLVVGIVAGWLLLAPTPTLPVWEISLQDILLCLIALVMICLPVALFALIYIWLDRPPRFNRKPRPEPQP